MVTLAPGIILMLEAQLKASTTSSTAIRRIALQADSVQAEYNLATALEAKGDIDGAVTSFQTVLKIQPGDARAHAGLASALERKGDSAGALAQYETALSLAPRDSEIRAGHDTLVKRIQSGVDNPSPGSGRSQTVEPGFDGRLCSRPACSSNSPVSKCRLAWHFHGTFSALRERLGLPGCR
jgi:tetratricopeptide (TPR) repeat protein